MAIMVRRVCSGASLFLGVKQIGTEANRVKFAKKIKRVINIWQFACLAEFEFDNPWTNPL